MKAEGAEEKPREELLEGDKEVSSSDRAPKGYKGDPSDSQEVAFRRMQVRLTWASFDACECVMLQSHPDTPPTFNLLPSPPPP